MLYRWLIKRGYEPGRRRVGIPLFVCGQALMLTGILSSRALREGEELTGLADLGLTAMFVVAAVLLGLAIPFMVFELRRDRDKQRKEKQNS